MFSSNKLRLLSRFYLHPSSTDENRLPYWHYYGNRLLRKELKPYQERYKLHISIHPDQFHAVAPLIHRRLNKAVQKNLITLYKVYDLVSERLRTTHDNQALRQCHNPFVIYLNDAAEKNNLRGIAELCNDIEAILNQATPGSYRTACDLPLTPHIVFRQAYLNADTTKTNYIRAEDAAAHQLANEGAHSTHYQWLLRFINDTNQIISSVVNDILSAKTARKRAAAIERWIAHMKHCFDQNELHTCFAINTALNHDYLQQLTLTQYNVSKNAEKILFEITEKRKKPFQILKHTTDMLAKDQQPDSVQSLESANSIHTSIFKPNTYRQTLDREKNHFMEHIHNFREEHYILSKFLITTLVAAAFSYLYTYFSAPKSKFITMTPTNPKQTSPALMSTATTNQRLNITPTYTELHDDDDTDTNERDFEYETFDTPFITPTPLRLRQ
jgi:hypothetical protein